MTNTSDSSLAQAAQAGDRDAFGHLVERHRHMVYGVCYRMTANRADAEDLAHDAFVEAFLKLAQLKSPECFGGWLRTLSLNLCRMWYRRRQVETEVLEEDVVVVENGDGQMDHPRLVHGLSLLAPARRMVLVLHYWEGWSYGEIARFLEVPLGTVMSRLHRARQALRDAVELLDEEETMTPDEEFRRAIDAEIDVLLRLFGERREPVERLRQILEHSPGRFGRLVDEMDEDMVEPLVLLLRRLGRPAIEVVLECYFSDDANRRTKALELLVEVVSRDRDWHADRQGNVQEADVHATLVSYLMLDLLIGRAQEAGEKTALLVSLMEACEDTYVAGKFRAVLLCYGESGFPFLLERFWEVEDRSRSPVVLALCVLGSPFCRVLLEELNSGEHHRQKTALEGLRAFAYRLDPRWVDADEVVHRDRYDRRFPDLWPPLSHDLDPDVLPEVKERVSSFLEHEHADLRDLAVTVLGQLRAGECAEDLRSCARHPEQSTRLAALQALAEIGDPDGTSLLCEVARAGSEAEQCTALTALGRLRVQEAQGLFMELAQSGSTSKVREEAINGLGQIGGQEAHAFLQQLMRTGDRQMRRKAARWMTGKKLHESLERDGTAVTEEPTARQRLAQQRIEKIRGATQRPRAAGLNAPLPQSTGLLAYISIDLGIRVLPELRPYPEFEFTQHLAGICHDYAFTRRLMADKGLIERRDGVCELSQTGESVWRVEHYIMENYLRARAGT